MFSFVGLRVLLAEIIINTMFLLHLNPHVSDRHSRGKATYGIYCHNGPEECNQR